MICVAVILNTMGKKMSDNYKRYIISVMAADRIGIIHNITRTISVMGGDLADTRQQVLQGYFSMILYASFPEKLSGQDIVDALTAIDPENPFEVSVKPVTGPPDDGQAPMNNRYVLTARGSDRIGFVALVSGFCAEHSINILDLSTTTGSDDTYTMILLVDLSRCPPMQVLRTHLEDFSTENGLSLLLQHQDIFRATNEIGMI